MINTKDFTFDTFRLIINALDKQGYQFVTYEQFVAQENSGKLVVMRHDVDHKPGNAVKMALLESEMNIASSYYFGMVNKSYSEDAIAKIAELGHELGYHYNDLAMSNGNFNEAFKSFNKNLQNLRQFYPVKTMCMHGSPLSKWDNRSLWAKYNYRELGIVSEPYLDLDFNKVLYLTDASRTWNNIKVTIRDRVDTCFDFDLCSTFDIIRLIESNKLPDQLLINIHPHNWSTNKFEWVSVFVWQWFKNQIKKLLIYIG